MPKNESRNRVDRARAAARRQGLELRKEGAGFMVARGSDHIVIAGYDTAAEPARFFMLGVDDVEAYLAKAAS